MQSELFLERHDVTNRSVFDATQILCRKFSLDMFCPRLQERLGSEKAADMVGPNRGPYS
jgi:hypothetical protein